MYIGLLAPLYYMWNLKDRLQFVNLVTCQVTQVRARTGAGDLRTRVYSGASRGSAHETRAHASLLDGQPDFALMAMYPVKDIQVPSHQARVSVLQEPLHKQQLRGQHAGPQRLRLPLG